MMRTTTASSIQEQLQMLSTYTDEEISRTPVKSLKSVLSNLGIHSVYRLGTPVPLKYARKVEMLETLLPLAQRQREYSTAIISTETSIQPALVDVPSARQIFDTLKFYMDEGERVYASPVDKLAHNLVTSVALAYPNTSEQLRYNYRCAVRTKVLKQVREMIVNDEQGCYMEAVFTRFRQRTHDFSEADNKLKRESSTAKVDEKAQDKLPVRTRSLVRWSIDYLHNFTIDQPATEWKQVTIALALVTGRRVNEILCSATSYQVDGEYTVTVTGLSKGKEADEVHEIYELPTLAPANTIVRAIEWLELKGKREIPKSPSHFDILTARERCNKRFGKELRTSFKQKLIDFNVCDELTPSHTFHALRKFYVLESLRELTGERSRGKEAARLLGHRDWASASDNYISQFELAD